MSNHSSVIVVERALTSSRSLQRRLAQIESHEETKEQDSLALAFDNYLETGFQLATFQGPLCAEPVEGVAYFVEAITLDREGIEQEQGIYHRYATCLALTLATTASNRMAHLTGSFISAVRDACRNGLLDWSPRLMLAMYTCDIQASSEWIRRPCYLCPLPV